MIGFVTCIATFKTIYVEKGGQVTKSNILVKICYKLLYLIQRVKNSFDKVIFWPQLISKFLVTLIPVYNAVSDWPHSYFLHYCLAYHYFLSKSGYNSQKLFIATYSYPTTMLQLLLAYVHFHHITFLLPVGKMALADFKDVIKIFHLLQFYFENEKLKQHNF